MRIPHHVSWPALGVVAMFAACTVKGGSQLANDESGSGNGTTTDGGDGGFLGAGPSSGNGQNCASGPDEDFDGDGMTAAQGDCNDCDPNTGPGAVEVVGESGDPLADEDCDGEVDEPPTVCDQGLTLNDVDPLNGAKAMDLCETVAADGFGVITARYVRANGDQTGPLDHVGLMDQFGPNVAPRRGSNMLALSSGNARLPGQPGECGSVSCGTLGVGIAPAGFPQDVPGCMGATDVNDDIALEVQLLAPTNATGMAYEFNFYSHEYPEWVCTEYNDQFIALVSPPPMGSIGGNISFDSQTNPVSVNIALFDVCEGCALGTGELTGTGFDTWGFDGLADAGATSWLQTTAPITGGEELNVRFAIWDTGDTAYDSTVVIDNFTWIADGGSVEVGTVPVPD